MRRASRIDANHVEIVDALRHIGCSVQSLATIGKGCPDLMVALRGRTACLEIKDGQKPVSAQRLTPDEVLWIRKWRGEVHVVSSVREALQVIEGWR